MVLVSQNGGAKYHVMWSGEDVTAPALLLHLGLLPDIFHVFVMGSKRPKDGCAGVLVTDDFVNLWLLTDRSVKRMVVHLERLPLDEDELAALSADPDGATTAHLRARPPLGKPSDIGGSVVTPSRIYLSSCYTSLRFRRRSPTRS